MMNDRIYRILSAVEQAELQDTARVLNTRNTELIEKLHAAKVVYTTDRYITPVRHPVSGFVGIAISKAPPHGPLDMSSDVRVVDFDNREAVDKFINALTEIRTCLT